MNFILWIISFRISLRLLYFQTFVWLPWSWFIPYYTVCCKYRLCWQVPPQQYMRMISSLSDLKNVTHHVWEDTTGHRYNLDLIYFLNLLKGVVKVFGHNWVILENLQFFLSHNQIFANVRLHVLLTMHNM